MPRSYERAQIRTELKEYNGVQLEVRIVPEECPVGR
jgi:hypothetical protein